MRNKILLLFLIVGFLSCEKEEIPVSPHVSGAELVNQVSMETDYRSQLFFDLGTNAVISSNLKTDWDLAFESSPNGTHILLNTSKGMSLHKSDELFEDLVFSSTLEWNWDAHSGNLDSTAFGDWELENKVYILDLGFDHLGAHEGYYKLEIENVNTSSFSIKYGVLATSTFYQEVIQKESVNLFTYYSFTNGPVAIAPPNEEWDIEFTQYTHLFINPFDPYVVTGVLINRYETKVGIIDNKNFHNITFQDTLGLALSTNMDAIGYGWKEFDFDVALYIVDPTITYIIKTNEGFFYKLHFIDFYNNIGQKGCPKFEYQQL